MATNDGFCSQGIVSPPLKPQSPAPSSTVVACPRFKAAPAGPSAAMLLPATRQGCRIQRGSTPGTQSQQFGRGLPPGHGETFQCLPSPPTLPIPITSQLHPSCSSLGSHHSCWDFAGWAETGGRLPRSYKGLKPRHQLVWATHSPIRWDLVWSCSR